MVKTNCWQRLIASGWLITVWQISFSILATTAAVYGSEIRLDSLGNLWMCFLLFGIVAISFLIGWFSSVLFGWPVLGIILMAQGTKNGGPYEVGDLVQILSGEYKDTVTRVYSTWQHESSRVKLGDISKEKYEDIFADHQLLRVE